MAPSLSNRSASNRGSRIPKQRAKSEELLLGEDEVYQQWDIQEMSRTSLSSPRSPRFAESPEAALLRRSKDLETGNMFALVAVVIVCSCIIRLDDVAVGNFLDINNSSSLWTMGHQADSCQFSMNMVYVGFIIVLVTLSFFSLLFSLAIYWRGRNILSKDPDPYNPKTFYEFDHFWEKSNRKRLRMRILAIAIVPFYILSFCLHSKIWCEDWRVGVGVLFGTLVIFFLVFKFVLEFLDVCLCCKCADDSFPEVVIVETSSPRRRSKKHRSSERIERSPDMRESPSPRRPQFIAEDGVVIERLKRQNKARQSVELHVSQNQMISLGSAGQSSSAFRNMTKSRPSKNVAVKDLPHPKPLVTPQNQFDRPPVHPPAFNQKNSTRWLENRDRQSVEINVREVLDRQSVEINIMDPRMKHARFVERGGNAIDMEDSHNISPRSKNGSRRKPHGKRAYRQQRKKGTEDTEEKRKGGKSPKRIELTPLSQLSGPNYNLAPPGKRVGEVSPIEGEISQSFFPSRSGQQNVYNSVGHSHHEYMPTIPELGPKSSTLQFIEGEKAETAIGGVGMAQMDEDRGPFQKPSPEVLREYEAGHVKPGIPIGVDDVAGENTDPAPRGVDFYDVSDSEKEKDTQDGESINQSKYNDKNLKRQSGEERKIADKHEPSVSSKIRDRSRISLELSGPMNMTPMHVHWSSDGDAERSKDVVKREFKDSDSSVLSSRERIKSREDKIKARLNDIKQRYNSRRLFMQSSSEATDSTSGRMHGRATSSGKAEETQKRSPSGSNRKTASLIFQPSFSVNSVGRVSPSFHDNNLTLRSSQSNSMILMSNRLGSFGNGQRTMVFNNEPYTDESVIGQEVPEANSPIRDSEFKESEENHFRKPSEPGTILETSVSSSSSELKECDDEPGHSSRKDRARFEESKPPRRNVKRQQTPNSGETYDNFVNNFMNSGMSPFYGTRTNQLGNITIQPIVDMKSKLTPLVEVPNLEVSVSKDTLDVFPHSRSSTKDKFMAELRSNEKL